MATYADYVGDYYGKVDRKLLRLNKHVYQYLRSFFERSYSSQKNILIIVGCQRSGTSILQKVFEKDFNTKVYGETSKLSSVDTEGLRLNPLPMVEKELQRDKAQFIIMKPLVESQNICELLDTFAGSQALWLYRDYKDVASSNLQLFGIRNGIDDIRPIAENQPNNWRSERVSEHTRQTILQYFSEDMNPYDAAVLFWYARNSLFFDLELDQDSRVMMCKYEDLIASPETSLHKIYAALGQFFPGEAISKEINSESLGKGKEVKLSPGVENLAKEMLGRLDAAYSIG